MKPRWIATIACAASVYLFFAFIGLQPNPLFFGDTERILFGLCLIVLPVIVATCPFWEQK
ncbi:hypothetical protein [Xanthomonas citri]|uniref:hypothetical protein n=1 Tax=Xanthomonas citri TaxID=346 RepID=UPI001039AC66|nr:hypothetical protein [Xanthomonas citri]MCC8492308.1 hypothetical protein [Xanthomonas citri pv. fuscans]